MTSKRRREGTAVPQTRIGRLVSLGLAAGELAVGGAVEGLRRFASAQPGGAGSVFLTAASAERLAARLARLRGAAMKLGQLLSLEGEDLVPPEFAARARRRCARARPRCRARSCVACSDASGAAAGRARFARFDVGADRRRVDRPGAPRARRGRPRAGAQDPVPGRRAQHRQRRRQRRRRCCGCSPCCRSRSTSSGIVAEAKRQLHQEADYRAEARHLAPLPAPGGRRAAGCVVPRVHDDLTTRRVLAMDFVRGEPLDALARRAPAAHAATRSARCSSGWCSASCSSSASMQTDPNFANYLCDRDAGRIVLLDFGATREFSRPSSSVSARSRAR